MRRLVLTMTMLGVLAACQSNRENDPPVIDESACTQRQLESGSCTAE
jgi:hypothetical protein